MAYCLAHTHVVQQLCVSSFTQMLMFSSMEVGPEVARSRHENAVVVGGGGGGCAAALEQFEAANCILFTDTPTNPKQWNSVELALFTRTSVVVVVGGGGERVADPLKKFPITPNLSM